MYKDVMAKYMRKLETMTTKMNEDISFVKSSDMTDSEKLGEIGKINQHYVEEIKDGFFQQYSAECGILAHCMCQEVDELSDLLEGVDKWGEELENLVVAAENIKTKKTKKSDE